MMKAWPDSVATYVHSLLEKLWDILITPEWFKCKILQPIPKADTDPSILNNLRPLMLIEPLRKVWVGISIRRIRYTWEKNNLLNSSQYGFRHGRSCSPAILQLINCLETAQEEKSSILLSSWDVRRAFDSITRPNILLSLERLGVPSKIAEWLAYMDNDDTVTVRTPFSSSITPTIPATFSTGQGTGQGDISSPDIWNAFMDMLLTLLANHTESRFYFKIPNNAIHPQQDIAYADDLISISPTLQILQDKADHVSAFALFFGLKINSDKLRAFQLTWGSEIYSQLLTKCDRHIIIRTKNWDPIPIPLATSGHLKYLGGTLDGHGMSTTEKQIISKLTKGVANTLLRKHSTPAIKISTILTAVYPWGY
jgi:hypothetical protein